MAFSLYEKSALSQLPPVTNGSFAAVNTGEQISAVGQERTVAAALQLYKSETIRRMTTDELKTHLNELIGKYVTDQVVKARLLQLTNLDNVPAKEILVELTPFTSGRVSEEDKKVIGEIAYYFC